MAENFSLFINFNGECRQAMEFYAKVFKTEARHVMTYGDTPPDQASDYELTDADKDRIMYAGMPIFGMEVMFSDSSALWPTTMGNNISPTLSTDDMDEIKRLFAALSEGGEIGMELQKTFWSDLYGMVTDRFGVTWQLSHDSGIEYTM